MKEAIQKAIEGGYENAFGNGDRVGLCFLDPLFWQCLGKALGWEENSREMVGFDLDKGTSEKFIDKKIEWLRCWHSFINHLAEGKNPDDFFKELLT